MPPYEPNYTNKNEVKWQTDSDKKSRSLSIKLTCAINVNSSAEGSSSPSCVLRTLKSDIQVSSNCRRFFQPNNVILKSKNLTFDPRPKISFVRRFIGEQYLPENKLLQDIHILKINGGQRRNSCH